MKTNVEVTGSPGSRCWWVGPAWELRRKEVVVGPPKYK